MAYRRSQYLISPQFQLKLSLFVCSWVFALSLVFPWIIHELFLMVLKYAASDPLAPGIDRLTEMKKDILTWLMLLEAGFVGILFLVTIFVSHRIAGPLHKLKLFFRKVAQGDLRDDLRFRKSDHFKDVAEEYNHMIHAMRGAFRQNSDAATHVMAELEAILVKVDPQSRIQLEKCVHELKDIKHRALLSSATHADDHFTGSEAKLGHPAL